MKQLETVIPKVSSDVLDAKCHQKRVRHANPALTSAICSRVTGDSARDWVNAIG
jgi:hypothetical protein